MSLKENNDWLLHKCQDNPIVPVLTIDDPDLAIPLITALSSGGIRVVEITLRTPKALDAIRECLTSDTDCIVGAGTLLTPKDVENAKNCGAVFGVSPGSTPEIIAACRDHHLPFLPGAATPTEVMHCLDQGFHFQKFFPAEPLGGLKTLNAIAAPIPQVRFCSTGGVSPQNAAAYLRLRNVVCVGGSWLVSPEAVSQGDFAAIEKAARQAVNILTVQQ